MCVCLCVYEEPAVEESCQGHEEKAKERARKELERVSRGKKGLSSCLNNERGRMKKK